MERIHSRKMKNNHSPGKIIGPLVLKRWADFYDRTSLAYFLRVLHPFSTLLTVIGLIVSSFGLIIAIKEISENREVREATLWAMLIDRLELARNLDVGANAVVKNENREWECEIGIDAPDEEVGQIQILERMNNLGLSLRNIQAGEVNLRKDRHRKLRDIPGIQLQNADLRDADLSGSYLRHADLSGSYLLYANLDKSCLKDATLQNADLTGSRARFADFSGAYLSGTNLTNAKLRKTSGLEEWQLNMACADPNDPPKLPENLEWNGQDCSPDQQRSF